MSAMDVKPRRVLVTYESVTGNTKRVAEAIAAVIPGSVLLPITDAPAPEGFDRVFVGFWCDKGHASDGADTYLKSHPGYPFILFGTLGGVPGVGYSVTYENRVREELTAANVPFRDFRLWQGKIDPALVEKSKARFPMTPERRVRIAAAATHPDEADLNDAQACALGQLTRS